MWPQLPFERLQQFSFCAQKSRLCTRCEMAFMSMTQYLTNEKLTLTRVHDDMLTHI